MSFYILHYKRKGIFRSRRKNKLQTGFIVNVHGHHFVITVKNERVVMLSLWRFSEEHNYLKSRVDKLETDILPYVGKWFLDSQDFATEILGITNQNIYDWAVSKKILLD